MEYGFSHRLLVFGYQHPDYRGVCHECGGLVRVWTRYTLRRPKIAGPGAYDQTENSAHLLATGLLGQCPGRP